MHQTRDRAGDLLNTMLTRKHRWMVMYASNAGSHTLSFRTRQQARNRIQELRDGGYSPRLLDRKHGVFVCGNYLLEVAVHELKAA